MKHKRFGGKTGKEYELFKLVCPYFEELENNVGKIIKKQFQNNSVKEIKVLEIGCGPGYTTLIILESDKRTKVIAVDNEAVMIKQAKINLNSFVKNNRIKLVEEDALKFLKKQKPSSFDVFASGFTLHNFTKEYRQKVIREIYKVLKSGGIFVNADKYAYDSDLKHKKSLKWQLKQFKEGYSKINRQDLADEWTKHYLEDDKPNVIMKEAESIRSMSKIGFKDIKVVFRHQMEAVLFARK